uniref:Uncharacterized protein n=1 Tax=Arundo donax TaxID=35708 RepID=A0A0A9A218_ARUDO
MWKVEMRITEVWIAVLSYALCQFRP